MISAINMWIFAGTSLDTFAVGHVLLFSMSPNRKSLVVGKSMQRYAVSSITCSETLMLLMPCEVGAPLDRFSPYESGWLWSCSRHPLPVLP